MPLNRPYHAFVHCALFAIAVLANPLLAQEPATAMLTPETELEFVSVEKGMKLIAAVDGYVGRTSALERQFRLQTTDPVSIERFTGSMQRGVLRWSDAEIDSLKQVVVDLGEDLRAYDLAFPKKIFLIRVAASVEANMPHCRGAAIVLPDGFFQSGAAQMKKTMAHELFHVLSSHNAELRDKLYAIIGFQRCNEIALPDSLAPRRLTNPDAPVNEHRIELTYKENESLSAVPIITLDSDRYTGGVFMQHMRFRLMVVEKNEQDHWSAKLHDGQPELLEPSQVPDFEKRIGRNTRYIIHPEETLADNFWMLVLGKADVPDPWVIEKMRELLRTK